MGLEAKISLKRDFFSEKERSLIKFGDLIGTIWTYSTGVHAVKIENNRGYIVLLPFKGQQVWDAVFDGRSLKMKAKVGEPQNTNSFLNSYETFVMHCGATRMGCPSREDTHPLHGELPYADYQEATIVVGEDDEGKYMGLGGLFEYKVAFSFNYRARPLVKLYEGNTVIDISMEIENVSSYPMELMYMEHVNFRPVEGGKIVQSLGWTSESMRVRESIPQHVKSSPKYERLIQMLKSKPELTREINHGLDFTEEVVFFLKNVLTDENGWAHFMQVHPDGSADYISYKPEEFDHATRWIIENEDLAALSLALPATADAEGYLMEKKKGNVKEIPGNSSRNFSIRAGYLDKKEVEQMQEHINSIKNNSSNSM